MMSDLPPACLHSLAAAALLSVVAGGPSARANVYPTNIKLNGGTTNVAVSQGASVAISYLLNEPASLGVTVNILAGTNVVRSVSIPAGNAGTLRGTNTVFWDGKVGGAGAPPGTYGVSVTAASSGYTNWTQISTDTNSLNLVWDAHGIAVNRNPASPYYGRIFVANAHEPPYEPVLPGDFVGILKLNADASAAEEGVRSTGGVPWLGDSQSPWKLEVSDDDYVYVYDWTAGGALYRFDPTISEASRLTVLRANNWPAGANLTGPCVTGSGTNTTIWMADAAWPNGAGILKYAVGADGTCATNDLGTTVVGVGSNLTAYPYDLAVAKSGTIYTIQHVDGAGDSAPRVLRFRAYDPATNSGTPLFAAEWMTGGGRSDYCGAAGIAVDPTENYVAVSFLGVNAADGNTKVLYASNLAVAAEINLNRNISGQTTHSDTDCAWDAVGNLYYIDNWYGAWRIVSPPGTNQATTAALPFIQVIGVAEPHITSVTLSNATVYIQFTASTSDSETSFVVYGTPSLAVPWQPLAAHVTRLGPGLFLATLTSSSSMSYYLVQRQTAAPTAPRFTRLSATGGLVTLDFTASASDSASAFTLLSAPALNAAFTPAGGANIAPLGSNAFRATVPTNGSRQFYLLRR